MTLRQRMGQLYTIIKALSVINDELGKTIDELLWALEKDRGTGRKGNGEIIKLACKIESLQEQMRKKLDKV